MKSTVNGRIGTFIIGKMVLNKNQITIIDNFFDDVSAVRDYALSLDYTPFREGTCGYRSHRYSMDNDIERTIIEKVCDGKIYDRQVKECKLYSHISPEHVMSIRKDFHTFKMHTDTRNESQRAGVVYITPEPPPNSGTCINGHGCIENNFNRYISYPASFVHGPNTLFGQNKEDCRMTITFFLYF